MSSELALALDRLCESVDALRITINQAAAQRQLRPSEVYLDDLRGLRDSGLIDQATYARKVDGFLERI